MAGEPAKDWVLELPGGSAVVHSADLPFLTAVRREKVYTASHGSVKVQETEAERIPLTEVSTEEDAVIFSAEGHAVRMTVQPHPTGAELLLQGEEGWAYEIRLPALAGEAIFGGGEQYRKVNLRGERVVNFVSEHIKAATIVEKALLPKAFYKEKDHSSIGSYSPMPVFVTDRGRVFLIRTQSDGYAEFGEDSYLFSYDSCPESILLLHGRDYRSISALLAEQIPNRQYLPDWCHDGMILGIQGGTETILQKTFAMLDAGAKICGVWSQDWSGENRTAMGKQVWWNWEVDDALYPDLKGAIAKLRERGVRFLAYINPYLVKDGNLYNFCRDKGYLITKEDGSVYHIRSTTFDAGMLDLTNPEAVRYMKEVLIKQNMLDLGVSGWMADFGEYLPVDCVLHDGDPKKLHNQWPVMWAKLNREAIEEFGSEEIMFFTRSGYLGAQTYAPIMWNGDQHTDTTRDYGMPCVMPASFSLGFSGLTLVHSDVGGFFSFGKLKRDGELFVRWMEMCAFSPLMRSHESIRPWANAQFDAEGVTRFTVKLTRVHAGLKPYLQHCVEQAQQGIPAMRPDFWEAGNYTASRDSYSYFLGDDLYVVPVIGKKKKTRTVHLPEGDWQCFWCGKEYAGGKTYRVPAPLGKIPVFYRKGSSFAPLFREVGKER